MDRTARLTALIMRCVYLRYTFDEFNCISFLSLTVCLILFSYACKAWFIYHGGSRMIFQVGFLIYGRRLSSNRGGWRRIEEMIVVRIVGLEKTNSIFVAL